MASKRSLYFSEDLGKNQYRLRIQDHNSFDLKQWFVFERRTRTIRIMSDRTQVISGKQGLGFKKGNDAVARKYKNQSNQKISFWVGKFRNVRNNGRQCLDVHGGRDVNKRHTVWWSCHNGLNQAWWIDTKAIKFPPFPLKDGLKFQIKSRMAGHRALHHSEAIGGDQLRLRIQDNNPDDIRQWFAFDSRTNTIRSWSKKTLVLANQQGQGYKINVAATMRPWKGEIYQRTKWFNGSKRNIRNLGGKCLDVHGGRNVNNRHVIFWNCHNGKNQAWHIDQVGFRYPKQPLADGVKFQIKSQMKENRALFYSESIGQGQFRLRIQDNNPEDNRQWFVFNRRTRTIRSDKNRKLVLANQEGQKYKINVASTMRPWKKEPYQRAVFYGGPRRNIRNNGRKCLDVHGGKNTHNRHVIFWNCHNGLNQAWYLDRKGVKYNKYPLRDGVLFQIKSQMKARRALIMTEHIGKKQYRLRIRNTQPKNQKQWFVFDWRTKTIRAASDRKLALSNQIGQGFTNDRAANMRPYKNSFYQRIHWVAGNKRNIQNNGRKCLDVHGGRDSHNRHVIFWNCHNGRNQAWVVDTKVPKAIKFPPYPLGDDIKFQIKSRMAGNRALYWRDHKSGSFRTYIQDNNPADKRQWFIFNRRTLTVRAFAKRTQALSGLQNKMRRGIAVVMRAFKGQPVQRIMWLNQSRRNVRFNGKLCMDVHGGRNVHNRHVIYWSCHKGLNQAWYVDQTGFTYPKQPYADGVRFQIKSRMATFRALYYQEAMKGGQFRLRIRDNQPKNNRQWFIFDKRTRTIRSFSSKNLVISNLAGSAFRIGRPAVVRQYKNEVYQRLAFYGGSRRNIRNNGQKCLDVHGAVNKHKRHVTFWNCHNGLNQAWFLTTAVPKPAPAPPKPIVKPIPPIPEPQPSPPMPTPKRPKKAPKPSPPGFDFKTPDETKTAKPEKPIRYTFTYRDMLIWYKKNTIGTGIRWNGRFFKGTKAPFNTMVNYFVKVIGRRPSATRYQWLYKIVQCIVRREPVNNKILRTWVQRAIRGRRDKNYKVPACVKHLWKGRLSQKPTYHDLASLVRFAFYNRRITYRALYLFTWSVLNEDKSQVVQGHTEFWKRYAGIRSQYQSGLTANSKFMILNSSKKIVIGDRITAFTKIREDNYFFFDQTARAIRSLSKPELHLGVVGGIKAGSRVRLVKSRRGKQVRRQDWFVYDTVDMRFHSFVNKDLCISFRNPTKDGDEMTLDRCVCHQGMEAQQELLVRYFVFGENNGFKPWRVFTMTNTADKNLALSVSNDGSLLLPSQRYAKVAYGNGKSDSAKFYWDPTSKCLRNYQYSEGCVGTVQQGCSTQLISLGQSQDAGRTCADVKYDGTFLWINGKVAQPQGGYLKTNNIHISMTEMTGMSAQRWTIKHSNVMANKQKSKQERPKSSSSWGFETKGFFEIKAYNGQVLFVEKDGKIALRTPKGTAEEQFAFDGKTKTIVSRAFKGYSLSSQQVGKDRFRLTARKTQRTSPELFTKPGKGGIIQMAANKNYVWRVDKKGISIVPGNGNRNWKKSRTYFQLVNRGGEKK